MKVLSLIVLRALPQEPEATTLASAYMLDDFNFFQRERYVLRHLSARAFLFRLLTAFLAPREA